MRMNKRKNHLRLEAKSISRILPALCIALNLLFIFPELHGDDIVRKSTPVRNCGFSVRGGIAPYFTQATVDTLRTNNGWTCPDVKDWPQWWNVVGKNGTVEFPRTGGVQSDGYAKLGGQNVFLTGYHSYELEKCNYIYTVWARGKGRLQLHLISYGKDEAGKVKQLTKVGEAAAGMYVKVDSVEWVRYRHLLVKMPLLWQVNPWIGVEEGLLDIDEVDISASTPALDLIVAAESALYGSGALIENMDVVKADDTFKEKVNLYRDSVSAFFQVKNKIDKTLAESIEKEMKFLEPYVLAENITLVRAPYYNEMMALTQVLNKLSAKGVTVPAAIKAQKAESAVDYKPGMHKVKQNTVMVVAIKPNKILYEESESATAKVTLINTMDTTQTVTLTAWLYADLDNVRNVAQTNISIAAGGKTEWNIDYNVGSDTYGRALEVQVMDASGKELDRWQEYYQVGREWLRVQMHTFSRYNNMVHFFASEPTDWGIQSTSVEEYIAGQPGYHVKVNSRRNQIKSYQKTGKKITFYQNASLGGIMGYEEMRKHPEYVLYDENGQFSVDPVYGGYPSPMEIASPIETGPRRTLRKPYLGRKLTPWQHCLANFGMEEVIEYGAKCIREYSKQHGFDGVFIDGLISATKGYGYDGKINIPENKEEVARLNARLQNLYCNILKEENPFFGTWYNYAYSVPDYYRRKDGYALLGAGSGEGDSDCWIRAMNNWKNVSCLMEWQHTFRSGEGQGRRVKYCFNALCENRDYIVQKYGGNAIVGYVDIPISQELDKPGPTRWGWPTLNYFMAQIIASQHHIVFPVLPLPSLEPSFQFQTRYSSLLWSPDIRVVPEAERTVTVNAPEELLWKRLVYRRDTKDGYDLIIHLVRIPPTEKWDIKWINEPPPITGVSVSAVTGSGTVQSIYACRPSHFEEEQQVVAKALKALKAETVDAKTTVAVPPFRYYTMVVLRVKKQAATL